MSKFFIAVYTHEVKSYCDVEFFTNILKFTSKDYALHIVDNTEHEGYANKLKNICDNLCLKVDSITHLNIPPNPHNTNFHRKVRDSVNLLRDKFLESDCEYFLIIESDVITPSNVLEKFLDVINKADLIGAIYYRTIHKDEWFNPEHCELISTNVFSGCTLYKRNVIEKIAFRIDETDLASFPDSNMSLDANRSGFKTALYTGIKCEHAHSSCGTRNFIRN